MKFLVILFSMIASSSFASEAEMKNLHLCLNSLQKLYPNPVFHRPQTNGPITFDGKHEGREGIFFKDSSDDYRFIAIEELTKARVLYLRKDEYYQVTKKKKEIVINRIAKKNLSLAPLILYPITFKETFRKPLSILIIRYAKEVLKDLKKHKKYSKKIRKFDPDGLREFKAFNLCAQASQSSQNKTLNTSLSKLMNKLKTLSDIE